MILFEKFGQHQPLNRLAESYVREGVAISLSTKADADADAVGSGSAAPAPLNRRLEFHVIAAERLRGGDTTVPILAKGKTDTARYWSMSATTDHSAEPRHRPRCSTSRAIANP